MDRWPAVFAVLICLLSSAALAGPAVGLPVVETPVGPAAPTVPFALHSAAAAPASPGPLAALTSSAAPYRSRAGPATARDSGPVGGAPAEVVITVYANGSAEWTFRYRTRLQNDSEKRDFREFATQFESERTQLYREFIADARALTADAEDVTGRPMNAADFSRTARVETGALNEFGVVTMSFRWTNFGQVADQRVIVGDVFEGGLYLAPNQRLVIRPGPTVAFRSVVPEAARSDPNSLRRSDSVTYTGERRFTDNRPHVVFVPAAEGAPVTATAATAAPSTNGDGSRLLPVLLGGLLLTVGLGAWASHRNLFRRAVPGGSSDQPDDAVERGGDTEVAPPAGGAGRSPTDADTSTKGNTSTGVGISTGRSIDDFSGGDAPASEGTGSTADSPSEPSVTAADLQSDEDRVVTLLEEHGGRMRQSQIVEESGWSKSKVSMLLSDMKDEGLISKLRLGRENVISLPGQEPNADEKRE